MNPQWLDQLGKWARLCEKCALTNLTLQIEYADSTARIPMDSKHPVMAEKFQYQQKRFLERSQSRDIMIRLEPIFALECQLVLHAYYGGPVRAGWWMLRYGLKLWISGCYWGFVWKLVDFIGWTKIYQVPETEEFRAHQKRHGKKCSGSPNCSNDNCINDSIPRWFKKISGIGKYEI